MASKKVDNTRNLAPMTDPIAYRESYSESDIIKNPSDLIVYQEWKANNWWETAGSTVAQNNQSNAQNQSGTTYDWTDWNWRITVWPQNANLNYYQYWDDSNPNQQSQKGWMNDKYTWEWVRTSNLEFDKNITRADLDPNYLYWEAARQQNRKEAGYIARRNDMIASALYNEWLTSKDDVANFLSQQNQWMNSTEADRMNTIESVWKRLWQIQPEREQPDLSKAEDIVQDTSGKLYWKTTADEWNPKQWIDTLADKNNVLTAMQQWRVVSLQDFVSQDPKNIAECIRSWATYWSEQTWRDAQQYYPELIAEVNAEVKKINTQANVTAIASGGEMVTNTNWQSSISNEMANFWLNNATSVKSAAEITNDVKNAMAEKQSANEASETMATIEEDMAILKNRLKNLREEANRAFKWDVPDYMVNAYISNKTQEIQNQMSILEDRYNAAYNRYKTELAQTQWEKEYQLKEKQLQLEQKEFDLKKWATEEWIAIDWYKAKWTAATSNSWRELPVTTKTRDEIWWIVDNLVDMAYNKQLGNAQCAAWIQKYYFPKLWISIGGLSTFEAKKWLINTDEYYVPQKWDLIIIDSGAKLKDWTNAWHIWIVVQVDWDKVRYLDWNGDWKEWVAVRTTSLNNSKIAWYYDVTKWQTSWITAWTFSDADLWMFEGYLNWDLKDYQIKDLMNRYWVDENWLWRLANEALKQADEEPTYSTSKPSDETYSESDLSSIEVPDDVYIVDTWYQTKKVDPNSAEWKKLAQEYRIKKAKEMWIESSSWTSWTKTTTTSNLWFDKWRTDLYQWIIDWSVDIDTAVKNTGKSKRQLRKEVEAFQNAVDNWYDVYGYEWRNIDPELWFDPNRAEIYRWLIQNNFAVPWTQDDQKLLQLWLNPKDKNAWNIAIDEAHKYHERAKYNIADEQVFELTRALEFLIAQGATQAQRRWWGTDATSWWEMDDWNMYWNYIKNNWTLDHFEDIKKNWLTFWNLTEWELKIISTAANALVSNWRNATAWTFKTELRAAYNSLRKELWYEELSWDEFDAMYWIEDWGKNADWKNFLALEDTVDNTRPFWLWWTTHYRTYQGKDYNRWTEWYDKYWPWRTWLTSTREDLFSNK